MQSSALIKKNIFGGITAGIIALPLSLAFGVSSGLGATAGLYGAIIVCLFATIFGGTKTQISGPTGPMTVVIASMVLLYPNNPKLIFSTILLSGLIQIIFGFTKIGQIVKYVPYPVISGFMSGIGAIIILLQLNQILGLQFNDAPIHSLVNILTNIPNISYQSLALGILSLIIVYLTPKKITSKIPSALLALIIGTIASIIFNLNTTVIGDIPKIFPTIQVGLLSFEELQIALPLAFTLAVLGSIDSLLTSLVADSLTKTKHDSNKELIGQGVGNMAAGLFGGLAGAGATMRTVVNIKAGGSERMSGIVHSLFLISIIAFFTPFAAKIPLAVLAGILIKVGADIIDYKFLNIINIAPRSDLTVMLVVFTITVLDNLIFAVGVGIVLSSLLFAVNATKQLEVKIKTVKNTDENMPKDYIEEDSDNNIIIAHISGILFFGTASFILSRIEKMLNHKQIIIDCKEIETLDISAIFALEEMILRLRENGSTVMVVLKNENIATQILKSSSPKVLSSKNITFDIKTAIKQMQLN